MDKLVLGPKKKKYLNMISDEVYKKWVDLGLLGYVTDESNKRVVAERFESLCQILTGPNKPMSGSENIDSILETIPFILVMRIYEAGHRVVTTDERFLEEVIEFFLKHRGFLNEFRFSKIDAEAEIGVMFVDDYIDKHKTELLDKRISKHKLND